MNEWTSCPQCLQPLYKDSFNSHFLQTEKTTLGRTGCDTSKIHTKTHRVGTSVSWKRILSTFTQTKGMKSVIFPPRQSQQRPLPDPHPEQTSLIDPNTFKRVEKQKQNLRTFSAFPCKKFHQQWRLQLNPLLVNFNRSADGLFLVQ